MSATKFGRIQVPERAETLRGWLHVHDFTTKLHEVAHPPRVGVLDQEDLLAQGIDTSVLVPGAAKVDALGSCTAQATIGKLSSFLSRTVFLEVVAELAGSAPADPYRDVKTAEEAAIVFYHRCSSQTGDPGQEWPPSDCGSSGPYVVELLQKLGLCSGAKIASGADNIVSLMQHGSLLLGAPWLNAWMEPGADGMLDGNGSLATLQDQLASGIAGGHETLLYAIVKLGLLPTGHVDPANTILRGRNSWSRSFGDDGDYEIHLSTLVALGGQCDLRLLVD